MSVILVLDPEKWQILSDLGFCCLYSTQQFLSIPFLEIASVWFEPGVIAANIEILLSTSEQSVSYKQRFSEGV